MKRKQWLSMALACCMAVGSQTPVFAQENEETVELTALISKHSLTKDVNEMEWLTELERKPLEETLARMEETCDTYPAKFISYSTDDNATLAMNQVNIENIVKQTYAAWLTDSNRDIEAEWEDYVDSIYKIGLTQNLEIRQAAYDKYIESVK